MEFIRRMKMSNDSFSRLVGVNLIARIEILRALSSQPLRVQRFKFRGSNIDLPIVSVKINLPVYRIGNRRTKTLQEEYLANHPGLANDFFSVDSDSIAVQESQDEILRGLIADKDLYDVFTNPKVQQDEPIICTREGVVINGNRRLCAWRKLYEEDRVKYSHFESIEVMLLPEDADENDINNIERDLQIKRAIKAEYSWHARALMIKMDYEKVGSYEELRQMYDMSRSELDLAMECYSYAKTYLESIGRQGYWSLVDKHEFAFQKIVKEKNKICDIAERKVFEACASTILQANSELLSNRRYEIISQVANEIRPIIDVLKRDIMTETTGATVFDDPFGIGTDRSEVADIYRVERECRLPQNREKVVSIIKSVIEATNQARRDNRASHALLDDLTKISTDLISAKNKDLNDQQEQLGAVRNQLRSIINTCAEIEKWVNKHDCRNYVAR